MKRITGVIRLVAQDAELLAALGSAEEFRTRYDTDVGDHLDVTRGVVQATLEFLAKVGTSAPWIGYLCVAQSSREVIGCGSFKGGPDVEGCVEIAYFTFPAFEGRGYATETARALVAIARERAGASAVVAHTLPETTASTRILGKLGFEHLGEIEDPEDGRLWRWRQAI